MEPRLRSPRRLGIALALAIGAALGFGGYHAVRALDLADAAGAPAPAMVPTPGSPEAVEAPIPVG